MSTCEWGEYIKDESEMQRAKILYDIKQGKKGEKRVNWRGHKINSQLLSDSYQRQGIINKSFLCAMCGDSLTFERFKDGTLRLKAANFCKVRLCPMCACRRSLKIFGQTSKVMDYITAENDFRYIFLTLTLKNVPGVELKKTIDKLFDAFEKLTRRKEYRRISKGHLRCLEVTHNWTRGDDYHPHIHVIIVVNQSYFEKGGKYLSHEKWMSLWRDCAGLDYDPWVDIRTVKPNTEGQDGNMDYGKAVAEVAKYTVKASDFILSPKDSLRESPYYEELKDFCDKQTDEVVAVLDGALANRRLVAFAGAMKEAHKKLNLDKPDTGDLVNTDIEERIRPDLLSVIEVYRWCPGYRNYVLVEE